MVKRERVSFFNRLRNLCLWIFVFQLGLLIGIEMVHIGVFTGNEDFKESYNYPSLGTIGIATSLYPILAAFGAASVLYLIHFTGWMVILTCSVLLWLAGFLIGSLSPGNMSALMTARATKGFSIGVLTGVICLYTEEATSSQRQAALILTLLQTAAPFGCLLMSMIAKLATGFDYNQRWLLAAAPVFPIVAIVFCLPDSDCRLGRVTKQNQHVAVVSKTAWPKVVKEICELGKNRSNFMRFIAAALTQAAGSLTAINVIFYYSSVMCQMLGFPASEAEYMAIGIYALNFIGTALSLLFVKRLPRLATIKYTLLGLAVIHMILFLVLLSQEQYPQLKTLGFLAMAILFTFVFLFATLFSGISLVYTSEVVPSQTRNASIGLATSIGWIFNFSIVMVSAEIMPALGSYVFLLFAVICCILHCGFTLMPQPAVAIAH